MTGNFMSQHQTNAKVKDFVTVDLHDDEISLDILVNKALPESMVARHIEPDAARKIGHDLIAAANRVQGTQDPKDTELRYLRYAVAYLSERHSDFSAMDPNEARKFAGTYSSGDVQLDYCDEQADHIQSLANQHGVSVDTASSIWYLRQRSRWTPEMEAELIRRDHEGNPVNGSLVLSGEWPADNQDNAHLKRERQ